MAYSILSLIWSGLKLSLLPVTVYVIYKAFLIAIRTYNSRQRYTDIISLPRHWFWGNLANGAPRMRHESGRHPDYGFEEIWNELGQPSCFLFDIQPMGTPFLVVADPYIAEQITQPSKEFKYSLPKSDTLKAFHRLLGDGAIISAEGEEWRNLRKRFNRGFQPSHLHTLNPLIVEKTKIFVGNLEEASRQKLTFPLKDYAQDLTTDIIAQLTMEEDLNSQTMPEGHGLKSTFGFLTAARTLSTLALSREFSLNPLPFLNPIGPATEIFYEYIFNATIRKRLTQILSSRKSKADKQASGKSIVQLAVGDSEPTKALIENTVSQVKSFLFAGQDTTASLIQWMAYELSKASWSPSHAQIRDKLQAEHDTVFGPGKNSALSMLSDPGVNSENILNSRLPYTSAFIKETLRLHPPGSTARLASRPTPTSPPVTITTPDGRTHDITDLRIYVNHWLLQRNPKVYGPDVLDFKPERWLDESYVSSLPTGSWRAFESGSRSCVGSTLALIEAKVVLCAIARGFEFEKIGLSGRDGEGEVFNTYEVTSVPCDRMIMKVRTRGD